MPIPKPIEIDLAERNKRYVESDSCDGNVFAEMRSNLLLIAGEHYSKSQSAFFRRIRDSKQINEQQKLRLTKNHIQKITKIYANNIIAAAPGVGFEPKNENELRDQKSAELHHAVWQDAVQRYNLDEKIDDWCDDFIGVGEVITKIFFDADAGPVKHYNQMVDMESGEPQFQTQDGQQTGMPFHPETGQPHEPMQGEPIHKGEFVFENYQGFNVLRAPEARSMSESPYLIFRKMMRVDALTQKYPDLATKITASMDQTMIVFDPLNGGYHKAENQVMVREHFYRPCSEFPQGHYFIDTKEVELEQGDFPGGLWPIVIGMFEKIQTTPRGRSAVKQMRPYQAEINRSASKIAEHQITLGDDKIITMNGSKLTAGASLPGVRSLHVTGQAPTILAGRDGSQYLPYMQSQIEELYSVMMVSEISMDAGGQVDPYAMLFRAASQKKQFQRYIKRFERYLVEVAKLYIQLAKIHLSDDEVIYAVGRKEMVNIQEFKNSDDICYQIKVIPQADDLETKMGKQIVLNHLVQYTGANLSKEDLGKIIRLMPYANMEEGLGDLTLDYDLSTNDILAMDRGEMPSLSQYDNHPYCIKRAVSRMRQPDFKFLPPQIQQTYMGYTQQHEQAESMRLEQVKAMESQFIPVDGYLVGCDFYVDDPSSKTGATRRARVPYTALAWLIKQLETQGQSLDELEKMNQGAVAQMAQQISGRQGPNGMGPNMNRPSPNGMGPGR